MVKNQINLRLKYGNLFLCASAFFILLVFLGEGVIAVDCNGTFGGLCGEYLNEGDCNSHYIFNTGNYIQCGWSGSCIGAGICTPISCIDFDGDTYNQSLAGCGLADCDDTNASKWQNLYGFLDNDNDTYTTGGNTTVCSGAILPVNYLAVNTTTDCNDTNSSIYPGTDFMCGSCLANGTFGYNSSDVCRVSAGECDVAETCSGSALNCPVDLFNDGASCTYLSCTSSCLAGSCQSVACGGGGSNSPTKKCVPKCDLENCFVSDGCGGNCYSEKICTGLVNWICGNWSDCSSQEGYTNPSGNSVKEKDKNLFVVVIDWIVEKLKKIFGLDKDNKINLESNRISLKGTKTRFCIDSICQNNSSLNCTITQTLFYNKEFWSENRIPDTIQRCEKNCNGNISDCSFFNYSCGSFEICGKQVNCGKCSGDNACFEGKCICNENWSCSSWEECGDGVKRRSCTETNNCGTSFLKPEEMQFCSGLEDVIKNMFLSCESDLICSNWSACEIMPNFQDLISGVNEIKGKQFRDCVDKKDCYPNTREYKECADEINVIVNKSNFRDEEYINIYNAKTGELLARIKDERMFLSPSLDITFPTGNAVYYGPCSNGFQDEGEEGIDCGGDCKDCGISGTTDSVNWIFLINLVSISSIVLLLILLWKLNYRKSKIDLMLAVGYEQIRKGNVKGAKEIYNKYT